MARSHGDRIDIVYSVPLSDDRWVLEEENIPETPLHQRITDLLVLILQAWIARTGRDAMAGSNIALRWNRAKPSVGVDPDVYLVEPSPPRGERETSLCTWKNGHHPPRVAVEVASEETAETDYLDGPARYAASGTRELWVFDPLRKGPSDGGGPWALQLWRRTAKGTFRRVYQGEGPAFSRELGAWVVVTDEGSRLRVANNAAGTDLWPTAEEMKQAALEAVERELVELRARVAAAEARQRAPRRTPRR